MSRNGLMIFLTRPVSLLFIVCSVLFIVTTFVKPQKVLKAFFEKKTAVDK